MTAPITPDTYRSLLSALKGRPEFVSLRQLYMLFSTIGVVRQNTVARHIELMKMHRFIGGAEDKGFRINWDKVGGIHPSQKKLVEE